MRRIAFTTLTAITIAGGLLLILFGGSAPGRGATSATAPLLAIGSGKANVGSAVAVDITLSGVPASGQTGYAFDLRYDDSALTRQDSTTARCLDGEGGAVPRASGPSPYSAGCVNMPAPGKAYAHCSPGPCTLATVVLLCEAPGRFSLVFDTDSAAYVGASADLVRVATSDGAIACSGDRRGAPAAPTATATTVPDDHGAAAAAYANVAVISAGSASAHVGSTATVQLTLANVPSPGQIGYAFDLYYEDQALARTASTTGACIDHEGGVPPQPSGASPYFAGCVNLPAPGPVYADCSPGPCVIATVTFTCERAGTYALTLDPTEAFYAGLQVEPVITRVANGTITCLENRVTTTTATPRASPDNRSPTQAAR